MTMQSAVEATAAAVAGILAGKTALELPDLLIRTLPDFLAAARESPLRPADREVICDQAILILDQFYAHLPFKRARYGIDPVQRLRLLRAQLPRLDDDLKFHSEIIRIFTELRDAHTSYGLPAPYRGALAFLPFIVKVYHDEAGQQRFVVTQTLMGFRHPHFQPGVEITYWNGTPVRRAVERLAGAIPAGNDASKFSRGMAELTTRSLTYVLPPPEESVFLQYRSGQKERILQFPWHVASGFARGAFRAPSTAVCQPVADQATARKALWGNQGWKEQEELQHREEREADVRQTRGVAPIFATLDAVPESLRASDADFLYSRLPNVFEFQHPSGIFVKRAITPDELFNPADPHSKRFGYLRIKTFEAASDSIFAEFQRILGVMREFAPDGLVLDVRGNPGGSIKGAERLLQLLTPREITPARFHFANTPTIQEILGRVRALTSDDLNRLAMQELKAEFQPWIEDAAYALAEGLAITEGRPLTPPDLANDTGQVYQGPVALLIDAISYSATDIFAAGFQDHEIGPIIGVDENTGGGGGSRWWHQSDLLERLSVVPGLPLQPLPGGAAIGFASLRSTRAGLRAGQALEDLGVTRTIPYQLTKTDIMDWGSDLIAFACRELSRKTVHALEITGVAAHPDRLDLHVRSTNLVRLVCYVNGIPQFSGGADLATLPVPLDGLDLAKVNDVQIRGYAWGQGRKLELVVAARYPCPNGFALAAGAAP
ncbi:MAG: hypothetical protein K2X03_26010 [Bryobacteraceae bacterium]|nr:hypothetical protein [Bryobacteraceae bacterium]